ncbi:excisionase family DNA-binding protein [Streptomyces sp. NPDC001978]|uniref:excisionase family DNA-binding protein n=1 Tax=Streptomyces sp. NPDC001978 TaxID=3364627 RepID=UPI003693C2BE
MDRLLTVDQVAELLGTTVRFPRRLIEERRIEYVKVGRHVRIPERAVAAFIEANTIAPTSQRLRSVA